jgi:hypothetical protein
MPSPHPVQNLLTDVDTTPVNPVLSGVTFPPNVTVMNGIYKPWSVVHDDILTEVRALLAQHPDYTLESTGHSLGGSLTYLSYIALAQNFPGREIASTALAAFPIGNEVFAAFGTGQNGTMKRGNNVDDGVPVRGVLAFLKGACADSGRICTSCRRMIISITGL